MLQDLMRLNKAPTLKEVLIIMNNEIKSPPFREARSDDLVGRGLGGLHFFLIGLMGSGKSFWAERLSNILHIPAFHLDDEIEKEERRTIAEIFAEQGENYFRIKESEVLKSFAGKENFILSTGGGTPCFHNNMKWMNDHGITAWIDEPVEIIEERLKK